MRLYAIVDRLLGPVLKWLYRIELRGAERIPATGPCVVASNHECVLDGFFLAVATRRQFRFMAKAELYRYPVLRQVMEGLGCFPVERSGDEGRAVARGLTLLEQDEAIAIFPQGTSLPYRHRPYRRGAARLALAAGAPVVPVCLVNTEKVLQPKTHRIGRPRVTIVVGEPILVERAEPTTENATALTVRIEEAIAELRKPFGRSEQAWMD